MAGYRTLTYVAVAQGSAGTTALVAAEAGKRHRVMGCALIMDAAGTLKFTDGTADLTGAMSIAANGGFVLPASNEYYFETAAENRALNITTVTGKASGFVIVATEA